MTITTRDQLIDALGNNSSRVVIDKASLAAQVAGRYISLWRATGQPGQGAIPGIGPTLCDNNLVGAVQFNQQTAPVTSYLGYAEVLNSNNVSTVEFHDRLAHVGGLSLASIVSQPITGFDLTTLGLSDARRGDANFSDVQWWLEVYAAGGATASNATINVTYNDSTTGNLNAQAVGGTINISHWFSLNGIDPAAGKFIRGINSVILSASTGVAGNFGFTATRLRASVFAPLANSKYKDDWASLGLPEIFNGSCLQLAMIGANTTSGLLRGSAKIAHG
jgi:hypothetical protein